MTRVQRYGLVPLRNRGRAAATRRVPMEWKRTALSAALIAALAAAPLTAAEAHRHHGFPLFWPFVAGAAVVGTAAAIATAPLRAVAYPPGYYYAPPAYYPPAPAYYGPGYYAPP